MAVEILVTEEDTTVTHRTAEIQTENELLLDYITKFLTQLEEKLANGSINLHEVIEPTKRHLQS